MLILSNFGNHILPTKENIMTEVDDMIIKSTFGDTLHSSRWAWHENHTDAAFITSDIDALDRQYWASIIQNLPNGVSFTTIVHACHSGFLFRDAANRQGTIAYTSCGPFAMTGDGDFYFNLEVSNYHGLLKWRSQDCCGAWVKFIFSILALSSKNFPISEI